jgi:hypothetical protein
VSAGLRIERANKARDLDCALLPIDAAALTIDLGCVRGARFVLRRLLCLVDGKERQCFEQRQRAHFGESPLELTVRLVVKDLRLRLHEHGPRIQRRHHSHDADSGLSESLTYRALDRCGTAQGGEE